ncbi:hypothetical protein J5N97_030119 [Dioscorea zingiberensis]|uniref:Uncharacterized protein n=1 Tax=Dioscorea zingiberensis TaxID=325984 RepID=A0A9D5BXE2_9LILI|nr:hypothetical protein J5N97_030119 [Dioscorea zingiberensis]
MEIISGLLSCVLLCPLCSSLCKQYNYIRKLKEHKEISRNELECLKSRENDINDKVNSGRLQHGKNLKKEVTLWLDNLQELVNGIESMSKENGNSMCLRGQCPNCYSHLNQSKNVKNLIIEVRDLQEKGQFSDGLFVASLPERQSILSATDIYSSAAKGKRDEIFRGIIDTEVSKIRVFGMGGFGKTTNRGIIRKRNTRF